MENENFDKCNNCTPNDSSSLFSYRKNSSSNFQKIPFYTIIFIKIMYVVLNILFQLKVSKIQCLSTIFLLYIFVFNSKPVFILSKVYDKMYLVLLIWELWDEFLICILQLPKTTVLKSVHIKINLCNIFQDDYASVCNALRMKKMGMKNNTYQYFYLPIFLGLIFTVSLIPFSQRRFANMKSALCFQIYAQFRTLKI